MLLIAIIVNDNDNRENIPTNKIYRNYFRYQMFMTAYNDLLKV